MDTIGYVAAFVGTFTFCLALRFSKSREATLGKNIGALLLAFVLAGIIPLLPQASLPLAGLCGYLFGASFKAFIEV